MNVLFVPALTLLHAGQLTWDELLFLAVGLGLLFLIGFLGQDSKRDVTSGPVLGTPHTKETDQQIRHALTLQNVSHRYKRDWALVDISMTIAAGQRISILGPNGAGKSTLLKVLATILQPTTGDVTIGSISLNLDPVSIRKKVGFVSHQPLLYPNLTVLENLHFFGKMYHLKQGDQQTERLLKQVHLWNKRHDSVSALSQGQKQRVALARALLHNPSVVLLDEPYAGLDMQAAERLDTILDQLSNQGHTLLMTTHDLLRSYDQSDWILILADGQMIYHAESKSIQYVELEQIYRKVLIEFENDN